ncbi:MAG: SIS domain-containing protein [Candidatus Aminicenantes bacterium]|nr:SIS domain-containing protein [Candidatus Aminicenantes bacterium]
MSYIDNYFKETALILKQIDHACIEQMILLLMSVRDQGGRLFFLGLGGGAGNCSHAVNDFRKIARFEAYTPLDNVSELTARMNDEGWHILFVEWLKNSRLSEKDGVFVFSVGGGNERKNVSSNLVRALEYAKTQKAKIFGIVGCDGGYTAHVADACVVIPAVNPDFITPYTESFQSIIWHLIVSDPRIIRNKYKWESIEEL